MDLQAVNLNNSHWPWVGKRNAVIRVCRSMLVGRRMLPRPVFLMSKAPVEVFCWMAGKDWKRSFIPNHQYNRVRPTPDCCVSEMHCRLQTQLRPRHGLSTILRKLWLSLCFCFSLLPIQVALDTVENVHKVPVSMRNHGIAGIIEHETVPIE